MKQIITQDVLQQALTDYSKTNHNHNDVYALKTHNHDTLYAAKSHTHDYLTPHIYNGASGSIFSSAKFSIGSTIIGWINHTIYSGGNKTEYCPFYIPIVCTGGFSTAINIGTYTSLAISVQPTSSNVSVSVSVQTSSGTISVQWNCIVLTI